jgi:hypothetical protein
MTTCTGVPLLAPAGSSIFLVGNPTFIPINGGVSSIRAFVTRPDGQIVPNGTVIEFFTDLGNIDSQGKTNDGIALVNLVSDGHSGVAHVQAFSGGSTTIPTTTSSTSTTVVTGGFGRSLLGTLTTTTTTTTTIVVTTTPVTTIPTSTPVGAGNAEGNPIQILIGNVNATTVLVNSSTSDIVQGRPATITASVFDASGNPAPFVPVFFSISSGSSTENLQSGGAVQFTDNNGQAFDTLFTRSSPASSQTQVTVLAQVPSGPSNSVTVFVN